MLRTSMFSRILFTAFLCTILSACPAPPEESGDTPETDSSSSHGGEGQPCGPIGECDGDLVCFQNVCVQVDEATDGSGDGSSSPDAGTEGTTDGQGSIDAGAVSEDDGGTGAIGSLGDAGTNIPNTEDDGGTGAIGSSGDAGTNIPNTEADAGVSCDTCPEGTTLDEASCGCEDINECLQSNGGCDINAGCTNADVSGDAPTCVCKAGYFGDGLLCTEWADCTSDEFESLAPTATTDRVCSALSVCDSHATESQAPTATSDRLCACNTGYEGDGVACADTDECATNIGGCAQSCIDSADDPDDSITLFFACACDPGYELDANGVDCNAVVDAGQSETDAGAVTEDAGGAMEHDAGQNPPVPDAGSLGAQPDAGMSAAVMDAGTSHAGTDAGQTAQDMDAGSTLDLLDAAVAFADAGQAIGPVAGANAKSDFNLVDTNPYSPTNGQSFSPRQYLGRVSAWYFGSGG